MGVAYLSISLFLQQKINQQWGLNLCQRFHEHQEREYSVAAAPMIAARIRAKTRISSMLLFDNFLFFLLPFFIKSPSAINIE
jgi:hypothetical protein